MCHSRVRDRGDQIRLHRCLFKEGVTNAAPYVIDEAPVNDGIRPGKVDILKDAVCPVRSLCNLMGFDAISFQADQFTRADVSHKRTTQGIYCHRL